MITNSAPSSAASISSVAVVREIARPKRGDVVGQLLYRRQALGSGVHQHDLTLGQRWCVDEVQEQAGVQRASPPPMMAFLRRHVPSGLTIDIAKYNVTVPSPASVFPVAVAGPDPPDSRVESAETAKMVLKPYGWWPP